jgi:hypothetical protein
MFVKFGVSAKALSSNLNPDSIVIATIDVPEKALALMPS